MPLNEPRIFKYKPKWLGLKELEKTKVSVWFKTKTGTICVPMREYQKWEKSHKFIQNLNEKEKA